MRLYYEIILEGTRVDKAPKIVWPGLLFGKMAVVFFSMMLVDSRRWQSAKGCDSIKEL